jgi:hypothetical protein
MYKDRYQEERKREILGVAAAGFETRIDGSETSLKNECEIFPY